jgi:magnesium transporter
LGVRRAAEIVMAFADQHWVGDLLAPEIAELLEAKENHLARESLMELLPPEIGDVLMELTPAQRALAFRLLSREKAAEVFLLLPPEEQERLLNDLNNEQLANLLNEMEPDDRAELFEELPGQVTSKFLSVMKPEERRRTQIILGYPAESVGRIMTPDYLTLREDWTVRQALDHIRAHGAEVETFNTVFVIDDKGRLLDDVRLRQLILAHPDDRIDTIIDGQVVLLRATDDREEAVRVMERYDMPQLPVVDRDNVLVGMVTFDDVADVAEQETTEDIQKLGGMEALDVSYMQASIYELVMKRGKWLAALFLGEMLTASAMGYFQAEIEKAAVIALFLPLIISSGGNSGSQASTLIIRSMALGEITIKDWFRVFKRELTCGLLLGVFLGVIGVLRIHVWQWIGMANYNSNAEYVNPNTHPIYNILGLYHKIGITVGVALIGVVLWGSLMGSMLPFALRKLKLDPATISAPLVATLVDVTGLIIYFTTAMLILKGTLL